MKNSLQAKVSFFLLGGRHRTLYESKLKLTDLVSRLYQIDILSLTACRYPSGFLLPRRRSRACQQFVVRPARVSLVTAVSRMPSALLHLEERRWRKVHVCVHTHTHTRE